MDEDDDGYEYHDEEYEYHDEEEEDDDDYQEEEEEKYYDSEGAHMADPHLTYEQTLAGLRAVAPKLGCSVTGHKLTDEYRTVRTDTKYVIIVWLPPAAIGARRIHGMACILTVGSGLGVRINDMLEPLKDAESCHPHHSGHFCSGHGQSLRDIEHLVVRRNYEQALGAMIAVINSYNPGSPLRSNISGLSRCAGCGSDSLLERHCNETWCSNCRKRSAISRNMICPRCQVEWEGFLVSRAEFEDGLIKCAISGRPMRRRNATEATCCGRLIGTDNRIECLHCRKVVCRDHWIRGKDGYVYCQECHDTLFPTPAGLPLYTCASPNCEHGGGGLSASEFYVDRRTKSGLSKLCKACIAKGKSHNEQEKEAVVQPNRPESPEQPPEPTNLTGEIQRRIQEVERRFRESRGEWVSTTSLNPFVVNSSSDFLIHPAHRSNTARPIIEIEE